MNDPTPDAMFALFAEYPDLLDLAPDKPTIEEMQNRVDQCRPCIRCGQQTDIVMAAVHANKTTRWMDFCHAHAEWVREALKRNKR